MGNKIAGALIAPTLRLPQKNPIGYLALKTFFPHTNGYLEENAVKLCNIEPQHHVLEIGFGPGIGLKSAFPHIKDGTGKLYGVDWSKYVTNYVRTAMKDELATDKLQISNDTVMLLPFEDNTFDRIFHTNCFYFWTNMELACSEIYRTMKPNSYMVTCMNMAHIRKNIKNGYLGNERPDPIFFMHNLELVGFEDVGVKYLTCDDTGKEFMAIIAHVRNKIPGEDILDAARAELETEQEMREQFDDVWCTVVKPST